MRVCADTNVLVSALVTRGLCRDLIRTVIRQHQLVVGEVVLGELQKVLRLKFRHSAAMVHERDEYFRRHAEVFAGGPAVHLAIRDATDLPVISEALAGASDILVTGDADLLSIAAKSPIKIVSPRDCWLLLRGVQSAV